MDIVTSILKLTLSGFVDSIKGITVLFYLDKEMNKRLQSKTETSSVTSATTPAKKRDQKKKPEESKVLKRVIECCVLNGGIFWLSILMFEYGLLPGLQYLLTWIFGSNSGFGSTIWSWMQPFLSLIFGVIWVLPLFVLSKVVNSLWFADIADSAYKFRKGRPQYMTSISKLIADFLFSLLVQALFLVQSMVVSLLPVNYIGTIFAFIHMCLLYSLYSFEYKWFNMGWELHKRLTFIETNWPYFVGFGMPLAILTQLPSSYIVSGCVFSILFPLFILSGNEASPSVDQCEIPMRLFSPVVAISNALFSKSNKKKTANVAGVTNAATSAAVSHRNTIR